MTFFLGTDTERDKVDFKVHYANSEDSLKSARELLLTDAIRVVTKERNNSYGPPTQDFDRIAAMWSVIFDREFSSTDVALAMILLKVSRLTWDDDNRDSWLDIAGYAACGWETVSNTPLVATSPTGSAT